MDAPPKKGLLTFLFSELLDLLFFLRKCRSPHTKELNIIIIDRAIEAVQRETYNLKDLTMVLFDVNQLNGRPHPEVVQRLTTKIQQSSDQLTPFITLNIL